MNKPLRRWLFLVFGFVLIFSPLSAFAQTPPPCAVRSNFDLLIIEASTTLDIRLTSGLERFAFDTRVLADTKARSRVSEGLKDFEAELGLKFPDYSYFQLVDVSGVNLINSLSGVRMVALNPDILLRISYLGIDPKTQLHDVELEINGRFLSRIKLESGVTFFQAVIPYRKGALILGITLVWVKPSPEDLPAAD